EENHHEKSGEEKGRTHGQEKGESHHQEKGSEEKSREKESVGQQLTMRQGLNQAIEAKEMS
ncbi:MAG: hypothetical protein OER43_07090, partial [Gammaproteobacteria bacterium]|nr:hypothetical protein [Gammaproteobacteria bacterium]